MGRTRQVAQVFIGALGAVLALVLLALTLAPVALADTATPPVAAESNNLLIAVIALVALSAIVVLTRPKRGKQ